MNVLAGMQEYIIILSLSNAIRIRRSDKHTHTPKHTHTCSRRRRHAPPLFISPSNTSNLAHPPVSSLTFPPLNSPLPPALLLSATQTSVVCVHACVCVHVQGGLVQVWVLGLRQKGQVTHTHSNTFKHKMNSPQAL